MSGFVRGNVLEGESYSGKSQERGQVRQGAVRSKENRGSEASLARNQGQHRSEAQWLLRSQATSIATVATCPASPMVIPARRSWVDVQVDTTLPGTDRHLAPYRSCSRLLHSVALPTQPDWRRKRGRFWDCVTRIAADCKALHSLISHGYFSPLVAAAGRCDD